MTNSSSLSYTMKFLIGAACMGIIVVILERYAEMFNAIFLALIIVLAASPILHWLQRKGVSDGLALIITIVVVFAVGFLVVVLLVVGISQLAQELPAYTETIDQAIADIQLSLESLGFPKTESAALSQILNPGELLSLAAGFVASLVGAFSNIFLVVLVMIFLFIDYLRIPEKIAQQISLGYEHLKNFESFERDIQQYLFITAIVGAFTGIFDAVFLLIMGVEFAILWGVLAFFLSFIPSLGFWLALIPPTLLALLESGPLTALIVFVGFVIINGIAENVVKPKYMGEGLDLSPSTIILSLLLWGLILGPMGALLAIPLTVMIRDLILNADESTRWIAAMLSSGRSQNIESNEVE